MAVVSRPRRRMSRGPRIAVCLVSTLGVFGAIPTATHAAAALSRGLTPSLHATPRVAASSGWWSSSRSAGRERITALPHRKPATPSARRGTPGRTAIHARDDLSRARRRLPDSRVPLTGTRGGWWSTARLVPRVVAHAPVGRAAVFYEAHAPPEGDSVVAGRHS